MRASRSWVVPLGATLVVVAVVAGLPQVRRGVLHSMTLLAHGDVASIRALVLATGAWAPLVAAALMILQAVVAPLPSSPVTYANGLVFGVWWGGLLSWASALVVAALCFGLSRRFGRSLAERLMTPHAVEWAARFFDRFGVYAVLLGRLLPFVSFDLISFGAGLTRMSFVAFIAATAVGMIPGTLLYSYLGGLGSASGGALLWTLAALAALGVLVMLAGPRLVGRLSRGREDGKTAGRSGVS